jgi:hypothetical protein
MADTTHYINALIERIPLGRALDLVDQPNALFEIGTAPDGLPILLHVSRRVNVRGAVLGAMRATPPVAPAVEDALVALEKVIERHVLDRGVVARGGTAYYETVGNVAGMLGTTVLDKALGTISPMVLPEDGPRGYAMPESRAENSALFSLADLAEVAGGNGAPAAAAPVAAKLVTPAPTFGRDARLRVALVKRAPGVFAAPPAGSETADPVPPRAVVWESLLALRSASYLVRDSEGGKHEGPLREAGAYARALRPAASLGWSVSRADVGTLIAELARSVDAAWHARARVHGDLKPANVLLRREGIDAFDALDVAAGGLSAGLTASWAAPEQVLARPVTPATDVFALALMTVSLLGAAIYGEERTMIIPSRGAGRTRIKRITDPEVWIDPLVMDWPAKARVAWREFLMRCLAQDPARRPQRGSAFAAELAALLEQWELTGRLQVPCGPGQLEFLGGTNEPAWVLQDGR